MSLAVAALLCLVAGSALAQTPFTTINGSPLKINVGADSAFQIFNSAVPGVGQIFPSGCPNVADMGLFADIDGVLYAPDFANHGCGTATTSLGTYTPWQQVALTARPLGDGTPESPFTVGVTMAAPNTDVRVNMTVTYVRGNNFFRVRTSFTSNTEHRVNAYLGADIFLAGSDNGFFVSVPELNAVGGRNCDPNEGEYNILLIPITPASDFTAAQFADVWGQIGANNLDGAADGSICVDNGAAIEWIDIQRGGNTSVELNAAVSFGEIPNPANFFGFSIDVDPEFTVLGPGENVQLRITSEHNEALEFNSPITFSAGQLPPGLSLTFDQNSVPAPGDGTITATLRVDGTVFPQTYRDLQIIGVAATGETRIGTFAIDILCSPPIILGLPTSQPQSVVVQRNAKTTLRVKPESGGAFSYQWYRGHAPLVSQPIPNSNSPTLEVGPVTATEEYWVRVSNPCGSVNSLSALVTPSN
jgi:hypothetical protein